MSQLMFKLGIIRIKHIEENIDKLILKYKNKAPSQKFKDGTKNIIFHKERALMNEFIQDLNNLKWGN